MGRAERPLWTASALLPLLVRGSGGRGGAKHFQTNRISGPDDGNGYGDDERDEDGPRMHTFSGRNCTSRGWGVGSLIMLRVCHESERTMGRRPLIDKAPIEGLESRSAKPVSLLQPE
jgi:hypothetical protein